MKGKNPQNNKKIRWLLCNPMSSSQKQYELIEFQPCFEVDEEFFSNHLYLYNRYYRWHITPQLLQYDKELVKIFSLIIKTVVQKILIYSSLEQIAHIEFVALKHLQIGLQNPPNLEILASMNFPMLQHLYINSSIEKKSPTNPQIPSSVVSFRSIRKIQAQNLKYLELTPDLTQDFHLLREWSIPKLEKITFQSKFDLSILNELISCEINVLKGIFVNIKYKKSQMRIWKMLQQKHDRLLMENL